MSYPIDGVTYLEQIQKSPAECKEIRDAFFTLKCKYCRDHDLTDDVDLSIKEMFSLLGEAIELRSDTVSYIGDQYHFMWDVLDALFPEKDV